MVDIAAYIRYAKVAQAKDSLKIANQKAFLGSTTVPDYTRLLEIVRRSVEFMFANNPSEPNLENVANYMYNLSGKRSLTPTSPLSPFIIIIHPISQTVTVGTSVTFTVTAAGGTLPYTYQWQKNGSNIGGETNQSLTINPTTLGSAGTYDCVVTDTNGQIVQSNNATLVVNAAALTADWWYGDTDPWPDISTGTDNLTYLGSVPFTTGGPIVVPWPAASANNKYRVVRYPVAEGDIVSWVNIVGFNYGPIPGTAYNPIATITTKKYVVSKGDSVQSPYSVTYSE